jgi:hypothetical protein
MALPAWQEQFGAEFYGRMAASVAEQAGTSLADVVECFENRWKEYKNRYRLSLSLSLSLSALCVCVLIVYIFMH